MTKDHKRPKARAKVGKDQPIVPDPAAPTPTVARSPNLQRVEQGARNLNFALKKLAVAGPDAALDALRKIRADGYDPIAYSQQAIVDVGKVDAWIDHSKSLSGRKPGARAAATLYIEMLVRQFPQENTRGLWTKLRAIASNPGDRSNPTPGTCPFTWGHDERGYRAVFKGKKVYPFSTFRNAVSQIRQGK